MVSGLELSVVTDQRLVVLAPGEWPTPDPAPKVGLLLVQGDGISWDEARARCGRRSFRPAWTTPRSAAWTELPEHCAPRLDIAGHRGPKIQRLGVWFWEPGAAAVTSDPLGREVPLGKAR